MSIRTVLTNAAVSCGDMIIEGDEAHHARNVLRIQEGQQLRLCDGMGTTAVGVVTKVSRHQLHVDVTTCTQHPQPAAALIEVIAAPPKGSRFEDMLRALCELGVGKISLLNCERAGKMPRTDRCERIVREAIKQCGRAWLPEIGDVVDFSTLADDPRPLIVLDPQGDAPNPGKPHAVRLLLGPEGGLSPAEQLHLSTQGVHAVRIAPHILRIETAAVAAAAIWISAWGFDKNV